MNIASLNTLRLSLALLVMSLLCGCAPDRSISVHNPTDNDRCGYIAEVDAQPLLAAFADGFAIESSSGDIVPYQITHDGKLLVEVDVKAGQTVKLRLKQAPAMESDTVCVAQVRYDFQDDLTWENDRGGYRLYGPSYRNGGGTVSGYDIWTKSVDYPVLAQRYHDHCKRGISYHKDHGNGMDAYIVGRTLGAGMNALVDSGEILYPCAYEHCEILDNGPLRTTVSVTCYPMVIGGDTIIEQRTISLDKGSWLNKTSVRYNSLPRDHAMVTGIVIHRQNERGYAIDEHDRYVAYADLTDDPEHGNGVIYIGVVNPMAPVGTGVMPLVPPLGDAVAQVVNHIGYVPGTDYVYYWGAGWSKGGVRGMEHWERYLSEFHNNLQSPLEVTVSL